MQKILRWLVFSRKKKKSSVEMSSIPHTRYPRIQCETSWIVNAANYCHFFFFFFLDFVSPMTLYLIVDSQKTGTKSVREKKKHCKVFQVRSQTCDSQSRSKSSVPGPPAQPYGPAVLEVQNIGCGLGNRHGCCVRRVPF